MAQEDVMIRRAYVVEQHVYEEKKKKIRRRTEDMQKTKTETLRRCFALVTIFIHDGRTEHNRLRFAMLPYPTFYLPTYSSRGRHLRFLRSAYAFCSAAPCTGESAGAFFRLCFFRPAAAACAAASLLWQATHVQNCGRPAVTLLQPLATCPEGDENNDVHVGGRTTATNVWRSGGEKLCTCLRAQILFRARALRASGQKRTLYARACAA